MDGRAPEELLRSVGSNPEIGTTSLHVLPTSSQLDAMSNDATPATDSLHLLPTANTLNQPTPIERRLAVRNMFMRNRRRDTGCRAITTAPLRFARASKQYMYDDAGQEYLDCINGTAHVGHCHPQVVAAGQSQMSKLTTAQGFMSDVLTRYVKQLVETLPERLSVCYLCNSGSEANDLALRLARQYTGHEDIVTIDESYHGNLGVLIDISPKMFNTIPGGHKKDFVHVVPLPNSYRAENPDPWPESERVVRSAVANGARIAAFIAEPYMVIPGVFVPPKSYFQNMFRLIREVGGVCIADEVQTGLGRTGKQFWGFQNYGIIPDIVTVGKPLGNGHPMAAVICTREVSEKLGGYFSTFGGNPVSCAMGSAVIDIIHNEKLISSASNVGRMHGMALQKLQDKYPDVIGDVRGMGLLWGIEIVKSRDSKEPAPELAKEIMVGLKDNKILIGITGTVKNILLFTPPMCFTMENSRRFIKTLSEVITSLQVSQAYVSSPSSPDPIDASDEQVDRKRRHSGDSDDGVKRAREELEEYADMD